MTSRIDQPGFPGNAVAITKSDTTTYDPPVTVYVGGDGNVAIVAAGGGSAVTFTGLKAGAIVPCMAYKVMSTNTTATALVGIY